MSDARTKILNAASALFLEGGVTKMSVRAISKQAGLSTIGIYSYFQGKQGILDALYIEGFDMILNATSVKTSDMGSLESVLMGAEGYLKMATENEAHYRLIFGEGEGYEPSEEAVAAGMRVFQQLVSINAEYIHKKGLKIDPEKASMDIWALLHGYVSISHHTRFNQAKDWREMALDAVKLHLGALV